MPKRREVKDISDAISFNYFYLLKILVVITICVIHHNFYQLNFIYDNPFLNYIWVNGHSLVSVMFLMSGILYYFTTHQKVINNQTTFKNFALKKVKKFLPLVAITTLFIYILNFAYCQNISNGVDWIFASRNPFDLIISIICGGGRTIFGLPFVNNGPLWFLNVLLFCLLLAYPISKSKKNAPILFSLMFIYGFAMLAFTKEDYSVSYPFFTHFLGEGVLAFYFGILLGYLFAYIKKYKKAKIISKSISGVSVIAIIVFAIFYPLDTWENNYIWLTLFFYAPILILLFDIKPLEKLCAHQGVKHAGNMSFHIYAWNYPIAFCFYFPFALLHDSERLRWPDSMDSWWFLLIFLLIHLAIGILSYYLTNISTKKIHELKAITH